MTNIILSQDAEWEYWKIHYDEEMVMFAKDADFIYFWWLRMKVVVRKSPEGHTEILQNRKH
jgi:hypothetical protein